MAFDEENTSEKKTDAVEVAQGPVDHPQSWQHVLLVEAGSPYDNQVDVWMTDYVATIRTVDYADVRTIRLDDAAMEKLVDAWLARHPREATPEQIQAYLQKTREALNLDFSGVGISSAPAINMAH